MPLSVREQIVEKIVAQLNTIPNRAGWAVRFDANAPGTSLPEALVWRSSEDLRPLSSGEYECTLEVHVVVSMRMLSPGTDKQLDEYITDVEKALMADETWDGIAIQSFVRGSSVDPPVDGMTEYRGRVFYEVQYTRKVADPRTQ